MGSPHVDAALRQESETSLGFWRLVFRQEFELVVFVFVVADVAITGTGQYLTSLLAVSASPFDGAKNAK